MTLPVKILIAENEMYDLELLRYNYTSRYKY